MNMRMLLGLVVVCIGLSAVLVHGWGAGRIWLLRPFGMFLLILKSDTDICPGQEMGALTIPV